MASGESFASLAKVSSVKFTNIVDGRDNLCVYSQDGLLEAPLEQNYELDACAVSVAPQIAHEESLSTPTSPTLLCPAMVLLEPMQSHLCPMHLQKLLFLLCLAMYWIPRPTKAVCVSHLRHALGAH